MGKLVILRLLPVLLLVVAAGIWFHEVESGGPFVARNLLPLGALLLLSLATLWRGKGRWSGAGWQLPLGTLGFAIPALGLGAYLHYAFEVNLNGMFGEAGDPGRLFAFLPIYTIFAGAIGFAIGWIVGRNL